MQLSEHDCFTKKSSLIPEHFESMDPRISPSYVDESKIEQKIANSEYVISVRFNS